MNDVMTLILKDIRKAFIFLIIGAALAVGADRLYFSDIEWKVRTTCLDKKLAEMEGEAAEMLKDIEAQITDSGDPRMLFHNNTSREADARGIILLVYSKGTIVFWSDNSVAFPTEYEEHFDEHKPVFYSNEWFIPVHSEFDSIEALALIKVYRQYPIVNNILRSGFSETFWLPGSTRITFNEAESEFRVMGSENQFHFGLVFPDKKPNTVFLIIPVLLWIIFFFLLVRLIVLVTRWLATKSNAAVSVLTALATLMLVYFVILFTGMPPSVKATELFSPFLWSAGRIMPSVGHAFLFGLLVLAGLKLLFRSGSFSEPLAYQKTWTLAAPAALIAGGLIAFFAGEALFRDLVLNSAISFRAYKILDMSLMSLAGFLAVLFLWSVPVFLFMRAYMMMGKRQMTTCILVTVATTTVISLLCLLVSGCSVWGIIYILLLAGTILVWQRKSYSALSLLVAFSILTGIFSTYLIIEDSDTKEDKNMEVMAISMANDNDLVAEGMLLDMWPLLRNDTVLSRMVKRKTIEPADIGAVYRYLEDNYFNGYWENYDFSIVLCRNDSPLELAESGSRADNCFKYFDDRIRNEGDTITGTGFYFMHNNAGRAWYFTRLLYDVSPSLTNGLFIELVSHIETYLAGYPELLLDGKHQRFPRLREVSYAKYNGRTLVLRSGDYPYDDIIFPDYTYEGEYRFDHVDGYKHLYYNRGEMTLVLTTDAVSVLDCVITFAYLFIVVLLFTFILLMVFTRQPGAMLKSDSFRRRLQFAFAAVLSIVFIIVIAGALVLTSIQFRNNHTRVLREKATSLSIELDHKLAGEETLEDGWHDADYPSLNHLLVKFSNVFFTDINLYSPEGRLLATSRPEVFTRKLEGNMIDPLAYGALTEPGKEEYLGEETIGKLKYLSVYLPFYNDNNKLLAYLNVPYFAMQNLLAGEVSNLVVTLINFTLLLLLLMMWVAVFLSERLTAPLHLLQQAMASVAYGRKNEHIRYNRNDEIGELVRQYNRMTDELDDSAARLARTEREMAWREMARQVAHEIKNPLTPMKLNIQQLFKWWNDKVPDFGEKIRGFTNHQIEYIESLSNIASAFSYFARLPAAEPVEVDVITQLKTTLDMFGNTGTARVSLDTGDIDRAIIMADREHLNGIFSNLLKNALQAVPADGNGIIEVSVTANSGKVRIMFRDNGPGIPEELSSKMFTPNFTTKSSGMGLGLSIVKRYVETAGGEVWFETEQDKGTVFIVELPLLYTVDRKGTQGV
jgi:two-component system nitrogen regulation sensor histidine kinase NtrY